MDNEYSERHTDLHLRIRYARYNINAFFMRTKHGALSRFEFFSFLMGVFRFMFEYMVDIP